MRFCTRTRFRLHVLWKLQIVANEKMIFFLFFEMNYLIILDYEINELGF